MRDELKLEVIYVLMGKYRYAKQRRDKAKTAAEHGDFQNEMEKIVEDIDEILN